MGKLNNIVKTFTIVALAILLFCLTDIPALFSDSSDGNHIDVDTADPVFQIDIHDMDEYNKFVQTSKFLPDNFITWDMVKEIGAFYAFKSYSNTDISRYCYLFELDDGRKMEIEINPSYVYENEAIILGKDIGGSMTKTTTSKRGKFVNEGLTYHYINGTLRCIEWMINGSLVRLDTLGCTFPDLTGLSTNTVVGKFLSTSSDNQIAALNQLKDMVTK